ncbi:MAG: DivIVA domain-containing protein [Solirubrobacteraceae bacterium MAG38_C4-C5]|nr:DivIVA domain-containing protein [Candidatus Siliceabacter maunaloa]
MALDRQTIEKKDFPIGRRGYEPEAVDAHLAAVAEEADTLRRQVQRRGGASLAHAASVQVQAIVEAAESTAQEIERAAEQEAATIRREAQEAADQTRQEALERAQQDVGKVGEATGLMLQRVDAMESELGALVESLRTGANRLNADLSLLEGNMGELNTAAGREPEEAQVAAAVPAPGPEVVELDEPEAGERDARVEADEVRPAGTALTDDTDDLEAIATAAAPPAQQADEDVEGARLIALNMALNGQSREETDRYLAENFDLRDRGSLLDEVYASVEG